MAEGALTVPDFETQINVIANIYKKPLQRGDVWCLMDNKWYKQWKRYVGFDSWETSSVGDRATHPGPIDNLALLKDDGSSDIKDHLIDELDYVLIPKEGWDLLVSWYGIVEGQSCISRKVIEYGMFVKHCKVEVYLLEFKLCHNNDLDHYTTRKFSKADTIEYIEQEMRKHFNIPDDKETKLWNRYSSNTFEHLSNKESTVQDTGLYQGQVLVIEQKNDDGTWHRQAKNSNTSLYISSTGSGAGDNRQYSTTGSTMATRSYGSVHSNYNSSSSSSSSCNYDYQTNAPGNVQPGLCGLCNLGNTCFMNSALQCMSNSTILTDYFLKDQYWDELNVDNPLGMRGEIAKSYAELVKFMWSGQSAYTTPRNFKLIVGRFAPQFSGYQQQDCQELMAFLLDGLHEDLNRVKKKPYIELRDADGRPDEVVSKEAWDNYRKRNNSIIVDIFHGLLKSTLVCPDCSKISVTFDPFCYLSLPLPVKKERQIEIMWVTKNPQNRPVKMKVIVSKLGNVLDLCEAISVITGAPSSNMIVTDLYNHKLHRIYTMEEPLTSIIDKDDIFVYEKNVCEDSIVIPVYLKEKKSKSGMSSLFGQPFFILVDAKNCTYDDLYNTICQYTARYMNPSKIDWSSNSNGTGRVNGEVSMTNGDDYDSDDDEVDGIKNDVPLQFFAIHSVNSAGSMEVDTLPKDGSPIRLTSKTYLAAVFDENVKETAYDEKEAVAYEVRESMSIRLAQKKQVIQLSECLELFTTTEKLGADDPWYCPSCKRHQQATKKFDLWQLPQVLIIHLKRFSYNRYWRDKIDTMVEFPVNGLNMAKYIINTQHGPAVYDLIAVANHFGGMGGGHYTAYGKNKIDGQWYNFDDSNVSSTSEECVVSKSAYVLFYMRRDAHYPSSGHHQRDSLPAALGAPNTNQGSSPEDNASSSDEDCNMDVN